MTRIARIPLAVTGALLGGVLLASCTAQPPVEPTPTATPTPEITVVVEEAALTPAVEAILAANADWTTVNEDEWDAAAAVDLAPGAATTTITEAGVYRLSGDYGPIVVAAPDDALVVLVLDGARIAGSAGAAISVESADDVAIHLAEGSANTVAATIADPEADANAAIHAHTDLTISGSGSLAVTADGAGDPDGVTSTDDLVVLGGELVVTASDDGLRGKDALVIEGGSVTVEAGGDALKSDHDEDSAKGFVAILGGQVRATAGDDGIDAATDIVVAGGTVELAAADDGLHSEVALAIGGGVVAVTRSEEGIESFAVTIEGGQVSVVASDDGVNASRDGSGQSIVITGGVLTVDAGGDGLDSNGSIAVSGGVVVVHGPEADFDGALDADGGITVSGGELLAVGSAGMAEAPDASSPQSFVAGLVSAQAGSTVTISDASGTAVAELVLLKRIGSVVYSSSAIVAGESYTIAVDGAAATTVTAGELAQGMGQGGPGMGGAPGTPPGR